MLALIFLVYSIIAWFAVACLSKLLFISIQPGQWIDKLFNYQAWLMNLDTKGSFWVKPLGLCEVCFSHFISVLSFIPYFIMLKYGFHVWITSPEQALWLKIVINILWFLAYDSIGAVSNLFLITKWN